MFGIETGSWSVGSTNHYFVYIMTNKNNNVLYTGVTNNLTRRVYEHKEGIGSKFTTKYRLNKLVYYEITNDINAAISREKQIKSGSRSKKLDLINQFNPDWNDLDEDL
jgi:putative endonuclease